MVVLVLVSSIVIRGSQDRALVGFWGVGLSLTMVGCVGALELGSPFPSMDSELHRRESVKPHEAARYPARL